MIGRLTGQIIDDEAGNALVDVGGVGYEVSIPLGTIGRVTRGPGDVATLYVHTHVREDMFALFGFASAAEREVFRTLISISNVGPKLAMSVLSAISVEELSVAINRQEIGKLVAIPGVGKKTAERLVLELKGKLHVAPSAKSVAGAGPVVPASPSADQLVATLTRMGFRPNEAERAVATLAQTRDLTLSPMADLLRDALAILSR